MSNSVNEILIIGLGLIGASIAKASKEIKRDPRKKYAEQSNKV